MKNMDSLIDRQVCNVEYMAERSPAHPALNSVVTHIKKEPMKSRLRAAIEERLEQKKDEYEDGSSDPDMPYMGRV